MFLLSCEVKKMLLKPYAVLEFFQRVTSKVTSKKFIFKKRKRKTNNRIYSLRIVSRRNLYQESMKVKYIWNEKTGHRNTKTEVIAATMSLL